ncbi:hypothetical protein PGT21_030133 [Puccinia graminis f. sp. tritici]|uniref:Uncharacterized protein n=1 Tax=Puccinia graminis f. sp. tritici TaxID=56615 RepID=A0A5B0LZY2_PUCGR|nr:hypothetical protein PGT21_030133 [Puccinia graminis f. sp. tritici]
MLIVCLTLLVTSAAPLASTFGALNGLTQTIAVLRASQDVSAVHHRHDLFHQHQATVSSWKLDLVVGLIHT